MNPVVVDTSVWIDFFNGDPATKPLLAWLSSSMAYIHEWSLVEIRLGSGIPKGLVDQMERAPRLTRVPDADMVRLMDQIRLAQSGIGYVDLQILCSARERGLHLWTSDKALSHAARRAGLPRRK